jgi:archaellum biogenesis ATPase FlaH
MMTTRTDIETRLVAYSLQDERGYAEAMTLGVTPTLFTEAPLRAIWSLIGALVPTEEMPKALMGTQGGLEAFNRVLSCDYLTSQPVPFAKHAAEELIAANERDWYQERMGRLALLTAKGWDQVAIGRIHSEITERLLEKKRERSVSRFQAGQEFLAKKREPLADPVRLRMNIPVQDYALENILGGELVVVASRNGHGKTAWALQVAQESAKVGTRVLFITAEMPRDELVARMQSQETGINGRDLRVDTLAPYHLERLEKENADWAFRPLNIEEMGRERTGQDVCNVVRRAFIRGFQVVIIDYVGKIKGGKFNSRRDEMEDLASSLKMEAQKGKGVVIALAQLNRAAATEKKDKEIDTAYIADSDAWGREADFVQFISQQDDDRSIAHVSITKARHGEPGKFALQFNGAITRFVGEVKVASSVKKAGW